MKLWKLPNINSGTKRRKRLEENETEVPAKPKASKLEIFSSMVEKEALEKLAKENNTFAARIEALEEENKKLKIHRLKEENTTMRNCIKSWQPKRMNQALKRKDKCIGSWIAKYRAAKSDTAERVSQLQETHRELKTQQQKLKISTKKQAQRFKVKHLTTGPEYKSMATNMAIHLVEKSKEIKTMQHEVQYWQNEALEGEEALEEEKSQVVQTKLDGKSFEPRIREASYHLQDLGIAQRNVSEVMQVVSKSLTGKDLAGDLPSYATHNKMCKEMKSLSRQQVANTLKDMTNLTLKYDGTTKKVGHLVEVEVATEDQNLLLGLRQQVGGTADAYVKTITDSINTVEKYARCDGLNITANVKNTMTDRCTTNNAVDHKLEEHLGRKLNQFRCAMHPLDGMAKECEKVIRAFEMRENISDLKKNDTYPFMHRAESNTQATVRCTAKLFYDTQFNCDENLVTHLKMQGVVPAETANRSVVYHRFVGNRFHVYFLNSDLLYHYNNAIQEFFTSVCLPGNLVQQSVFNALNLPPLHTTTRALGLIGKLVTGPWMRLVGSDKRILEMNQYYAEAKENLHLWSQDAFQLIMCNPPSIFQDVPVKNDVVLESLLKPATNDNMTIQLIQELCAACLLIVERQLKAQLPGGSFWEPNDDLRETGKSCQATNISGERNFAISDQALYRAKNATPGHIESKVMFRVNKTGKWLSELDGATKEKCIKQAVKDAMAISSEEKEKRICCNIPDYPSAAWGI